MSDYGLDDSSSSQQNHGSDSNLNNISLDDPSAANNSIIGKVKSRVSSILPNSLSKWFSPSSKLPNDSLNGSAGSVSNLSRRRRHVEVEDDDDENSDDEAILEKVDNSDGEDEDDEDSQNSEDEYNASIAVQKVDSEIRFDRQPPGKKPRLRVKVSDSPLIAPRQPIIASTPSVGRIRFRSSFGGENTMATRSSYQRFTNLNLYSNLGKKEPAYNFDQFRTKTNTDIIDIISTSRNKTSEKQSEVYTPAGISFRRNLNIPSSSTLTQAGVESIMPQLKRQPLSTSKDEGFSPSQASAAGAPPRRTSTTINEIKSSEEQSYQEENYQKLPTTKYNGQLGCETSNLCRKTLEGQKHINGSRHNLPDISEPAEAIFLDSASESGESGTSQVDPMKSSPMQMKRKAEFFNTNLSVAGSGTATTTRNSSRTSSFGNGLNFYSHLEGKKSLFNASSSHGNSNSNQLNNSTLSLTSLNRRQFNSSLYGSTSALSDSRLLNTFSPFYKGKTTYGGAAAYNKYNSGASASSVRISPTLIRPTSSLSTLSSSSNSLIPNNNNNHQIGDTSNVISSTAKRILDLINDFSTPLSHARKMARSLKTLPVSSGRLNDNDLNSSRALRLAQVKSPYQRHMVVLQPSGNANNSSSGDGTRGGPLPPIRELQVPTMSQLLEMKKIQTVTEKVRNIRDAVANNQQKFEYSLPAAVDNLNAAKNTMNSGVVDAADLQQQKQKHTNKIKNKVSTSLRTSSATKDLLDEAPPPSINLPTLAFPIMQSVPKFDINFSSVPGTAQLIPTSSTSLEKTESLNFAKTSSRANKSALKTWTTSPLKQQDNPTTILENKSSNTNTFGSECESKRYDFKFSDPLKVEGGRKEPINNISPKKKHNYIFSPPLEVTYSAITPKSKQTQQPQLHATGSCLDVFRKPQTITQTPTSTPSIICTFNEKFKKSASEWECETCMIRNNLESVKCIACETPRKEKVNQDKTVIATQGPLTSTFGQQFKKSFNEWECDVCMVRNKEGSAKCVACDALCKVAAPTAGKPSAPLPLPLINNSFGSAFKLKSGSWECPTCMICNKAEDEKCVACETIKPGSADVSNSNASKSEKIVNAFKFGFASPQTSIKQILPDKGFQSLVAQQKASKWECDACMTRNDSERTKCACCEQPKVGATSNDNSSKQSTAFSFGATAAAKFSFGFSANTKEEDLRNENAIKPKQSNAQVVCLNTPKSLGTNKDSSLAGFEFGINPTVPVSKTQDIHIPKDETDTKNSQVNCLNFDSTKNKSSNEATSGFGLSNKQIDSLAFSNSTTITSTMSTPSVKFSITPPAAPLLGSTEVNKTHGNNSASLSFGSNIASSPTTDVFSLGTGRTEENTAAVDKKPIEEFTFKTPAPVPSITPGTANPSGFVFGKVEVAKSTDPTTNTISAASPVNVVSKAAVKPMFGFCNSETVSEGSTTTSESTFGGFSFGSNSPSTMTSTSDKNVGSVTSSASAGTTTTTSTSSSLALGSYSNTFGSFRSSPSTAPTFGSTLVSASNPANNVTIVSSSTTPKPTFGSLGGEKQISTNMFAAFGSGSSSNQVQSKPIASVLGNAAVSSTGSTTSLTNTNTNTFVFGSAAANNSVTPAATPAVTATTAVSSSTSWPKNNFVFGSGNSSLTTVTTSATNINNKEVSKPSVFGAFGGAATNASNIPTTSFFGNPAATSSNPVPPFGNVGVPSSNTNTNLFTSNSTSASPNIFGAANSGNALTPAPAFGSSPFGGGSASSSSVTPTFGSTALTGATTFGNFGRDGAAVANPITNGPEAKKPEPAFNFGTSAPSTQSTSGGFKFGSASSTVAAAKPAFNFSATTTQAPPAFNFTGSTESQNSTKPFQFGAIPSASAPVFKFGGGAIEATPNAPFQFNAGAPAPVSSNIFAPAPTPGTQSAQQVKRKIRFPLRRVTQR